MSRFIRCSAISRASYLAGWLVVGGLWSNQSSAQTAPAAPPIVPAPGAPATTAPVPEPPITAPAPQTAPAVPAPQIDPKARQLMDGMIAAYKQLKSYAGTMELKSSQDASQGARVKILYQKPNRIVVIVSDKGKAGKTTTVKMVSNGANIFVVTSMQQKSYLKIPAAPGLENIVNVLVNIKSGSPGLAPLAGGFDPLTPFGSAITALSSGPDNTLDGVPVNTVVANLSAPQATGVITYAIGQADHLLRRVTFKITKGPQTVTLTETDSDIKTDSALPQSTFAFVPHPGAKAIDPNTEPEPAPHDPRLKPGVKPFAFNSNDLRGRHVSLKQYRGKVVLMDFWAPWCGPCMEEMPNVIAAYKKFRRSGFRVLGIALDDDRAQLQKTIKTMKMPWRQIFDDSKFEGKMAKLYGISAIPTSILIGRNGKIAATDVRGPALTKAIRVALAKKH